MIKEEKIQMLEYVLFALPYKMRKSGKWEEKKGAEGKYISS
jgi:hypothetical protein